MRHQGGRKPFIFGLRSWQPYIQYRRSVQDDHHEQLSHKRMHPLTNPPADRHYLKTVVRFFGVSQSQNHSYLQMNYTHTHTVGMYKQQSKWGWSIIQLQQESLVWCLFCPRKWHSTVPSRLRHTCCALPRSSPRSCICRCIANRMMRRKCSPPELSIHNL
jgi:hypothetical protein